MEQVLTLIAGAGHRLDQGQAGAVRDALAALGADTAAPQWLCPDVACDLPFDLLAGDQAEAVARHALAGAPVDLAAQATADRRKRMLVADMDATMLDGESLDELAGFAGLREEVAALTRRSVNGEVDFAASLAERVGLLAGLSADAVAAAWERLRQMPGARTLVRTMRAEGACTVLVSGSFRAFTERLRDALGFDADVANNIEIADGKLTGRLIGPVLDGEGKLAAMTRIAGERQLPLRCVLAVGDGANDAAMLAAAGMGVAFRGKPAATMRARARIDHADLTALLYLQGYRKDEFTD